MKKLILLATVLISTGSLAEEYTLDNLVDEMCALQGEYAAKVMEARQGGVPMSTLMGNLKGVDESQADLMRFLIKMAYKENAYSSPGMQQRKIMEFRIKMESWCYEAFE